MLNQLREKEDKIKTKHFQKKNMVKSMKTWKVMARMRQSEDNVLTSNDLEPVC